MDNKLTVALIQSDIQWEYVSKNLARFERVLDTIKPETDLVILPEMFTTGFTMNADAAESMEGLAVNWIKQKAKEKSIGILGSVIIGDDQQQVFNRLIYCSKDGEIQTYDKRHLFRMAKEDQHFTAGRENILININGFRIRPLICYDLRFPVWSRNTFNKGNYTYDVLLYVANWPESRRRIWSTLLKARAIENISYVIGVNRVGEDGNGISYAGDSVVIDGFGDPIAEATEFKEEVLYSSLEMPNLSAKRRNFPVGLDADLFDIKAD